MEHSLRQAAILCVFVRLLNNTPGPLLVLMAKLHESLRGCKFNLMVLSKWRFQGSTAVSQLRLRFADGPGQGSPLGHCPAVTAGPSWQRGWHMTHIQWQKVVRWSAVSWIETKHKLSKKSRTVCHFVSCDAFQKVCTLANLYQRRLLQWLQQSESGTQFCGSLRAFKEGANWLSYI